MPTEAPVALQTDTLSPGPSVRALLLTVVLPNGTIGTVSMQVVAAADENGNPVLFLDQADWMAQMLDEQRATRLALEALYNQGQGPNDQEDFIDAAQAYRDPILET